MPRVVPVVAVVIALVLVSVRPAEPEELAERVGANPMVHAEGTQLVDGDGQPVQLRGVILEGWLMWNGTLWGAGLSSETKLAERVESLVGPQEAKRFRDAIYESFVTKRDIEEIAKLGFNVVRVPFNHTVLEIDGAVDASAPGWRLLDRLLDWCEAHDVYAVLDLHALPGGQSGVFVADPDRELVWKSEERLQRTVDLWGAVAKRYRNREIVAGYDLVNEPEPPSGADLIALYRRILEAIRAVDRNHLVILEGGGPASSDFDLFAEPLDSNQAYSFHTYNFFSDAVDRTYFENLRRIAETHDVPLWNGEIGAHTPDWIRQHLQLFADPANHVNGWIFWPWKRVPEAGWAGVRFQPLMEISATEDWNTVRKFLGSIFGLKKISKETAFRGLADLIEASQVEELVANPEMLEVLQKGLQPNRVIAPATVGRSSEGGAAADSLATLDELPLSEGSGS